MVVAKLKKSGGVGGDGTNKAPGDDLASDLVVTKYRTAANIANIAMKAIIKEVKEGADVGTLCDIGSMCIKNETAKIFRKEKNFFKGVAMPPCISIDNCICYFQPFRRDAPILLEEGQMVKIDLGAHVDGYMAHVAHTVVVGASKENKITGLKARVILAAYRALEVSIRMLKPKRYSNYDITQIVDKVAQIYDVKPVQNRISYQLEQNRVAESSKEIVLNPSERVKTEVKKCNFEVYEAYSIDIYVSSGEGKARRHGARTALYRKTEETFTVARMRSVKPHFRSLVLKPGCMPFTVREIENEGVAKFGVIECEHHAVIRPYPILKEKDGEIVAQFKCTVLILPSGNLKITGLPLDMSIIDCPIEINDPTVSLLLRTGMKKKKKKAIQTPARVENREEKEMKTSESQEGKKLPSPKKEKDVASGEKEESQKASATKESQAGKNPPAKKAKKDQPSNQQNSKTASAKVAEKSDGKKSGEKAVAKKDNKTAGETVKKEPSGEKTAEKKVKSSVSDNKTDIKVAEKKLVVKKANTQASKGKAAEKMPPPSEVKDSAKTQPTKNEETAQAKGDKKQNIKAADAGDEKKSTSKKRKRKENQGETQKDEPEKQAKPPAKKPDDKAVKNAKVPKTG